VRLEQLYQEVILDHYKHPHRRGLREPYGAESFQVNPTCGDEVRLRVALSDDGERIADVSYDGLGCSISQASTSVLTDQVIGQRVGDAVATVVDLGLVYDLNVEKGEQGNVALIDMTLTSAACPLTDVIEDQSRTALIGAGLVNDIKINWVWNPPWGPDKITEDGREQLRALGFTV